MDNTEAIRVLDDMRDNKAAYRYPKDFEALSLAIQALKPLPTLEEIAEVIRKKQGEESGLNPYIAEIDIVNLATAILDLLKGER